MEGSITPPLNRRTRWRVDSFLDVIIGKSSTIFQLFAGEDESLLIRGDSFLILNFLFHILDGVGGLDLQGDGLPGKGFDEDLHVA